MRIAWAHSAVLAFVLAGSVLGQEPVSPALPREDFGLAADYETESLEEPVEDEADFLFPQDGWFRLRGWLDGGIMGNTGSPRSRFNGPYNAVDRSNEVNFNQLYMIGEVGELDEMGIAGRVDFLWGEDFLLAQSFGMEVHPDGTRHWNEQYYGIAIPQAFVELGSRDLSLKVGHFYSIVGYEGVMSPNNFFYSHAYSYQFAGPFTHWGALGLYRPDDNWEWQLGLTNGWNGLDRVHDSVGILAGAKYSSDAKDWWSSFAVTTGQESNNVAGLPGIVDEQANRTRYSLLVGLNPDECVEYIFHQWLGTQAEGAPGGGSAMWYGVDQYLLYRLTNSFRAGLRFEWFRDQEGTRVGLNRASNPNIPPFVGNFYSLAAGLNWTPTPGFIVRPEIRADWFQGDQPRKPFQDGEKSYQLMLGVDAILKF